MPVPVGKLFSWIPDKTGKFTGIKSKFNGTNGFKQYDAIEFCNSTGKRLAIVQPIPATIPTLGTYVTRANKLLANPTLDWADTKPTRNNTGDNNPANRNNNFTIDIIDGKLQLTDTAKSQTVLIDRTGKIELQFNNYNPVNLINRIYDIYNNFVLGNNTDTIAKYLPDTATATTIDGKYSIDIAIGLIDDLPAIKSKLGFVIATANGDFNVLNNKITIKQTQLQNFIDWRKS